MHSQIKKFSGSKQNKVGCFEARSTLRHIRATHTFLVKLINLPESRQNHYLTRVGKFEHLLNKITLYKPIVHFCRHMILAKNKATESTTFYARRK